MSETIRKAVFAGRFYPKDPVELNRLMDSLLKSEEPAINHMLAKNHIIGAVVPHAGFVYSGYHAIHAYQIFANSNQHFDTVVIINPNHTGCGIGDFNLSGASQWQTPYGILNQDMELISSLDIETYDSAHNQEHSGEVQLPFLYKFMPEKFNIAMITMNQQTPDAASELARKIFNAANKIQRKLLLIASSDFTHYESARIGREKDQFLIDQIIKLDSSECFNQVKKRHITACGYGPIMTLIEYAKLAATKPKMTVLRRGNSGEISYSDRVVNYASILCYEELG